MPPPLRPRRLLGDEELGKRDDDHKPGAGRSPLGNVWTVRRVHSLAGKRNMKRIGIGLVVIVLLYYFFKNMPTDIEPQRRPHFPPAEYARQPSKSSGATPEEYETSEERQHYFSGPIKFYQLATSLNKIINVRGPAVNNNVLFAASSLKSAAILIPIACEMAQFERNKVHFALMSRDEIPMDILRSVNGYSQDCSVMFHDARPDFSTISTDFRMEVSSSAGLGHINTYMHPNAIIVDASGVEEGYFLRAFRERANSLGIALIELPANSEQSLMWLTRLDYASLAAWNRINIDILVHAQPAASGSLLRLLDCLKKADFFNSAPPRLTIELPQKVEEPTRRYLESFRWPPKSFLEAGPHTNHLTLRHRIPQHGLTAEENNIRFLESFWPADPATSHVLVLSPQVELSPLFYHYLKYTILEYKYSTYGRKEFNFYGISLDLPSTYPNDDAQIFTPPLGPRTYSVDGTEMTAPFLWQAPNSNAALYFGDKWMELHSFVSELLPAQHVLPTPTTLNEKVLSKSYPSWLESLLDLSRTRGYWMLYPNLPSGSLATVHSELYHPPQEYSDQEKGKADRLDIDPDATLAADPSLHSSLSQSQPEKSLLSTPLLNILPHNGIMPLPTEMRLLSWDGEEVDGKEMWESAVEFTKIFKREKGGCTRSESPGKPRIALSASDLFCLSSDEPAKESDPEPEPVSVEIGPVDEGETEEEAEAK